MGACQTYCSASTSGASLTTEDIRQSFRQVAIRHAAAPAPPVTALTDADVREQVEVYRSDTLRVVQYAPNVFTAIRHTCGVDAASFADEWDGDGVVYHEASRSLAAFLRSRHKRYMAKTISSVEVNTILAVALDLAQYWEDHPTSLMMRLLGLVRVEMLDRDDVGFLICASDVLVGAAVLDELFDLKGRAPKPPKIDEHPSDVYRVLKDKHLGAKFPLPSRDVRDGLMDRLRSDVEFLRRHGLMDYSVLVGVVRRGGTPPPPRPQVRRCSVVPSRIERGADVDEAGASSLHVIAGSGDVEKYHIGVIDLFTPYNLKKRVARLMKVTLWDGDTLSTMEPDRYAARLLTFCDGHFGAPSTSPVGE